MGLGHSPRIVTDGLVLALDAQNSKSWKSGTTWTDTIGGNNGTLTGGTSHSDGPFPEAGYVEFDGSTEYLSIADSADFSFGTGDYTMEAWIYPTSTGSYPLIIAQYENTSTTASWFFSLGNNTTTVEYYAYSPDGNLSPYLSGGTAPLNTWTHVAVTRSGSTVRLFVGGSQVDSRTWSNAHRDSSLSVTIGASSNGLYKFSGNISNVRIVKGTALYTSDFTPPSSPLTAVTNTTLLCCQGGTNVDASPSAHTFQVIIGVPTLTSVGPSATKYFDFDGSNDYAVTSKNIINPNTDFSMSVWSYKRDASISTFLSRISAAGSLQIRLVNNAVQVVNSSVANVGTFSNTATNIGQTYNIVVTRSGNVYSCYINGVYKSQFTSSSVYSNSPNIIGSSVVGGELYNGGIHALFCYNKALTASEVQQNYNALKGRYV
jgi:hypothetical protein